MKTHQKSILFFGIVLLAVLFYFNDTSLILNHNFFSTLPPLLTTVIFFVLYVAITALSLPGAAIMTALAGAIFGLGKGLLLASIASTIGATLAFLISRALLQQSVEKRFSHYFRLINSGIQKDGAFYLASLRLIPTVPFFVINLVMGLTTIRTWTFAWVSWVSMFPGTAVYVNAGTQLSQLNSFSLQGILTPEIILSFVLLGLFPWVARALVNRIQQYRLYRPFKKPQQFDYNLVVIGAGAAGLVSSYIAATVNAKVALIEQDRMGGDCLNTGCVPSKTLIHGAQLAHTVQHADQFGVQAETISVDFSKVMQRIQRAIIQIEPNDSVERYSKLGVTCLSGRATIISPWEVKVNDEIITTRNIIIASGGKPHIPPISGLVEVAWYSSDTIWQLQNKPERMLVIGGGPIGCELTQAFQRLGVKVTQLDHGTRLLNREDEEVSALILEQFLAEGIDVRLQHEARSLHLEVDSLTKKARQYLIAGHQGEKVEIEFDVVLFATGREANLEGLGLEKLKLKKQDNGSVAVNEYMQTSYHNIYACGDVTGPYLFTHMASHQAWYCAVNALFGGFKKFKVDYRIVPRCTFVSPEVAQVGLNEQSATAQSIAFEVSLYPLAELDRAVTDGCTQGFVKVLTEPSRDRILGVTIVGHHAGELITEYISAMKHGIGLNKILSTIHIYPTFSEANKYAAGVWKKAHAPQKVLQWLQKYHRYLRG